jgi:phenol 2-monooxygenase
MQLITIHSSPRTHIDIPMLPRVLVPYDDERGYSYDTVFADDRSFHNGHGEAYKVLFGKRWANDWRAKLVLVRPDMHVSYIGTIEGLPEVENIFRGCI